MLARTLVFAAIVIAVLGVALGAVLLSRGDPSQEDVLLDLERMNIRFESTNVAPAISEVEALEIARASAPGYARTASSLSARYGLLSNDVWRERLTDGRHALKYQDVPAWLVTYKGVMVASHGGYQQFNHELNVLVDAQTGEALFEFSYR
jgi:hypothetical protein